MLSALHTQILSSKEKDVLEFPTNVAFGDAFTCPVQVLKSLI